MRTELRSPGRSGESRRLEERILIRVPVVIRMVSRLALGLPPRSRLRRAVVAEAISRAYAAANRRDFDLVLALNDPDAYEYHPSVDLLPPDMETVFYGHDGYRRFWERYWLQAFPDIRWDPEEMIDFGERILVTTRQRGRGAGSGVSVSELVFQLFTLRRGLVVRQSDFVDRDAALAECRSALLD